MKSKGKHRQSKRRKPVKADKKTPPKTAEPKPRFSDPDTELPEAEQEGVFVVGAMINHVYVDVGIKDQVEVLALTMESEVLDADGQPRLDAYRFRVPSDSDVIVAFFNGKKITETGAYHNEQFQASVVVEGLLWGTDVNPDDLSKPIKVLKHAKLLYLAEAMADLADEGEGVMKDTEGMKILRTKADFPSQINDGYVHKVGAKAALVDTTAADGSMLMIEIQAKGWQECIEVLADQVEPWADA